MGKNLTSAQHWQAVAVDEVDGREATEAGDDAEARAMEEWAELMVRRTGVERRSALQCAAAIWDLQRAKDAACAGGAGSVVAWAGPVPGGGLAEFLEGLRMIALTIYNAPKRGVSAGALLLAMGMSHEDFGSARELALAQSVSHELTANAVEEWQRLLRLGRTSAQKSEAARKTYRDTNGKLARKAA